MVTLRIALLLIGALLILGVYLWSTRRRRRGTRLRYDPRFARIEPTRQPSVREATTAPAGARFDPSMMPIPAAVAEPSENLPRITREPGTGARAKIDRKGQLELHFDAGEQPEARTPEDPAAAREEATRRDLITLYVRARNGGMLVGGDIVRVLNITGMRFGDLDIFHHFGAGELRSEQPIFSAANMLEPGNFDLDRIRAMTTKGLVMFMQLPTSLDGAVAFELFLNTAQRVAEGLDGELYSEPRTKLDSVTINKMRRIAAAHGDGGL